MKRIAIIGASARAAALSALRAGLQVVAADRFGDLDLMATLPVTQIEDYPKGFVNWLSDQRVDGWLYTGALENYPDIVDQLASLSPLLGNSGEVLRQVRDPQWLAAECHHERLLFPSIISPEGYLDGQTFPPSNQWLAKTYQHSSGVGTWSLDEPEDWQRAYNHQAVVQLRVEGISRSIIYALDDRMSYPFGMTEQIIGNDSNDVSRLTRAQNWQYAGSLAMESPWPYKGLVTRIGTWLYRSGLRGVVGVDLIDDGKGLWIVEVNPRYTASIEVLERSSQLQVLSYWQEQDQLSQSEQLSSSSSFVENPETNALWGKAILYAKEDVKVSSQFKDWSIEEAVAGFAADLPNEETQIDQGNPVLTLFSKTSRGLRSRERLMNGLAERLQEAELQLYASN